MKQRIIRWLCGKLFYHEPTTALDRPLAKINEHGTIVMNQYRCANCDILFWQFGWSRWIQLRDDDPRMARVR